MMIQMMCKRRFDDGELQDYANIDLAPLELTILYQVPRDRIAGRAVW
jgi:hypothetical protein